MQISYRKPSYSWTKILLITKLLILLPIVVIGARTYYLYNKIQTFETYKEATNFLIQHKTTFLWLYKTRDLRANITNFFYSKSAEIADEIVKTTKKKRKKQGPKKPPISDRLADWLEARVMDHLANNAKIESFQDLPRLERAAIRTLDGTSYLSKLWQQAFYYTAVQETPAPTNFIAKLFYLPWQLVCTVFR